MVHGRFDFGLLLGGKPMVRTVYCETSGVNIIVDSGMLGRPNSSLLCVVVESDIVPVSQRK